MEYRIMTVTGCGTHSLVRIQRARTHFGWVTVWQQPYRMMFWPSRPCDAEIIAKKSDSDEPLDPDRVLSLYDDWRDPAQWPRTPEEADLFSTAGLPHMMDYMKVGKYGLEIEQLLH